MNAKKCFTLSALLCATLTLNLRAAIETVGTLRIASVDKLNIAAMQLGATFQQPLVGMMLAGGLQQFLSAQFGQFDPSKPISATLFVDTNNLLGMKDEEVFDIGQIGGKFGFVLPFTQSVEQLMTEKKFEKLANGLVKIPNTPLNLMAELKDGVAYISDSEELINRLKAAHAAPFPAMGKDVVSVQIERQGVIMIGRLVKGAQARQKEMLAQASKRNGGFDLDLSKFQQFDADAFNAIYFGLDFATDAGLTIHGATTARDGTEMAKRSLTAKAFPAEMLASIPDSALYVMAGSASRPSYADNLKNTLAIMEELSKSITKELGETDKALATAITDCLTLAVQQGNETDLCMAGGYTPESHCWSTVEVRSADPAKTFELSSARTKKLNEVIRQVVADQNVLTVLPDGSGSTVDFSDAALIDLAKKVQASVNAKVEAKVKKEGEAAKPDDAEAAKEAVEKAAKPKEVDEKDVKTVAKALRIAFGDKQVSKMIQTPAGVAAVSTAADTPLPPAGKTVSELFSNIKVNGPIVAFGIFSPSRLFGHVLDGMKAYGPEAAAKIPESLNAFKPADLSKGIFSVEWIDGMKTCQCMNIGTEELTQLVAFVKAFNPSGAKDDDDNDDDDDDDDDDNQ